MNTEQIGISSAEAVGLMSIGIAIGGTAVRGYMKSLLHDEGHRVYLAPDFEALQTVLTVCEDNGLEPSREIKDEKVFQALMGDNRTVFLVARPDVLEQLGQPTAAPMLRVKSPAQAALRAQTMFVEKGFTGTLISPLDDQTEGEIVFVQTNALSCGLIGFREHVVKMGKKPPKWSAKTIFDFAKNSGSKA